MSLPWLVVIITICRWIKIDAKLELYSMKNPGICFETKLQKETDWLQPWKGKSKTKNSFEKEGWMHKNNKRRKPKGNSSKLKKCRKHVWSRWFRNLWGLYYMPRVREWNANQRLNRNANFMASYYGDFCLCTSLHSTQKVICGRFVRISCFWISFDCSVWVMQGSELDTQVFCRCTCEIKNSSNRGLLLFKATCKRDSPIQ